MNASQSALEMNVQWLDDIENSQYHYKMSNTQLDALLPKGNPSREGDRLPTRTWTITNPHPNPSNLYGFCKVNFSVPRRILMREINAKDSNNSNTNASTTTSTGSANINSISNSHVHCISNSILNMEEFYTHVKNEKKEDVAVFPLANIHKNETFYVLYGSNAPEIVWLKHLVGRIKESNLQDSKVQRSRGQIHIMVKLTNNMDYFGTANNNAVNSNYLCYDPFGSVLNFLYLSAKRVLSFRGVYLPPTAGDPRTGGKGKSGLLSKGGVYPSHTGGSTLHFANAADEILLLTSSAQKLVLCFLILFQNLKSALMNNLNIYSKLLTEVVSFQTDLHLLAILHESTEERHRYNPNAHYNLYVNSILSVGFSFCLCPTKHIILLIAVGFFAKLAQTEYHNIVNMNTNSQNSSNSFLLFRLELSFIKFAFAKIFSFPRR
ncbi:hypothetical protein AGDE_16144 [Angomonas deanei]|nr:hypothetical protein AGDE_16144 [Angomonas deanei]|eukprot:EPY17641.1 hypothetical protein AGDE_16144 [Angomonas deanei]